jgi:hypothetical protein
MRRLVFLTLVLLSATACYHATIQTGLTPSTTMVEKRWASSWIAGLVPPSAVNTMQQCPGGVARVDTQLSFPNMLVGFLTFSIYTPMDIVVTCAQPRQEDLSAVVADSAAFQKALRQGKPFVIKL